MAESNNAGQCKLRTTEGPKHRHDAVSAPSLASRQVLLDRMASCELALLFIAYLEANLTFRASPSSTLDFPAGFWAGRMKWR